MLGTLYTAMAVMETLGSLLAGPLVSGLFGWSMRLGGTWAGMPFMLSFALAGSVAMMLFLVRASTDSTIPEEDARDEEEQRAILHDG